MPSQGLTHFDASGSAIMVDVSGKEKTHREAIASGRIYVSNEVYAAIADGTAAKGDVLGVARIAGIMAAKRTSDVIPMCHPLQLTGVNISFSFEEDGIAVETFCRCTGQTGVEMEALTAASIACLTIYDMCKAHQRDMVVSRIRLLEKDGGVSGHFVREENCE